MPKPLDLSLTLLRNDKIRNTWLAIEKAFRPVCRLIDSDQCNANDAKSFLVRSRIVKTNKARRLSKQPRWCALTKTVSNVRHLPPSLRK